MNVVAALVIQVVFYILLFVYGKAWHEESQWLPLTLGFLAIFASMVVGVSLHKDNQAIRCERVDHLGQGEK